MTSKLHSNRIIILNVELIIYFHDRWGLGSKDLASVRKVQNNAEQIITIDQDTLAKYLNEKIAAEIFKAVSSLSQFDIPGHVLIILILISIFSRDGVLMEKQVWLLTFSYKTTLDLFLVQS